MARSQSSIEVHPEHLDDVNTPQCEHGPAVLFERYSSHLSRGTRFYACSASRDRKFCPFYQLEEKSGKSGAVNLQKSAIPSKQREESCHAESPNRLRKFRKLPPKLRTICLTCRSLVFPKEETSHKTHTKRTFITDEQLLHPVQLLTPLTNKKTNAQYIFAKKTVDFVVDSIKSLCFRKLLCIGTPSIHEALQSSATDSHKSIGGAKQSSSLPESFLLDIDENLQQFFDEKQCCRYNMFNHHFFGNSLGASKFEEFVSSPGSESLLVVMDPPFGGLVQLLARTLKKIKELWAKFHSEKDGDSLSIYWFFPYYLEPRIRECFPDFNMLDYKVDYDNHPSFRGDESGPKRGSPVRIFTTVDPAKVVLPASENYRFCDICRRYVSAENRHCSKCDSCTSKDGSTYLHCDKCSRCVKGSRRHCDTCGKCELPDHRCDRAMTIGCHICGESSHKRLECPERAPLSTAKRKMTIGDVKKSKGDKTLSKGTETTMKQKKSNRTK